MTARQMKEREESLLQILGYKQFLQETNQPKLLNGSSSQQASNNLKNKKVIKQKYLKVPPHLDSENDQSKRLYTDNGYLSSKNNYIDQFYISNSTANNTTYNDQEFSSELPLISPQNTQNKKIMLSKLSYNDNLQAKKQHSTKNSSAQTYRKDDRLVTSNSNQIIEDIFINQQQLQRVSTPLLNKQASIFSRSRKSLLFLQLNSSHYQQESMKKQLQAITDLPQSKLKQISPENHRNMNQIFKDLKLDVKSTTNCLQKAKMLSPQHLEQNSNFSVTAFVSPRMKELQDQRQKQKNASEQKREVKKQSITSALLTPLSFQQLNTQASPKSNHKKAAISIQDEYINSQTNQSNLLERRAIFHNQQTNYQKGAIVKALDKDDKQYQIPFNPEYSKLNNAAEPLSNQQNRWKFNHPVTNQQIPEQLANLDQQNQGQALQNQTTNVQHQTNKRNHLKTDPIGSNENIQLSTKQVDLANQLQSQTTLKSIGAYANQDNENNFQQRKLNIKFEQVKGGYDNNQKKNDLRNSRSIKFAGIFDTNNQKIANYQKYKTTTLSNITYLNEGSEVQLLPSQQGIIKKKKENLEKKNTLQNFDLLEQFTQQQYGTQKDLKQTQNQNQNQIKQSSSQQIISNKLHLNLHKNISPSGNNPLEFTPSMGRKNMSKGQLSPKSTTSPIKRRLLQQQIHEDNYTIIHTSLIENLNKNEILKQYIESSGYSIEMFAFYMMKLYNFCIENTSLRMLNIQENNEHDFSEIYQENQDQADQLDKQEKRSKNKQEFPTLKVNEQTLMSILDIFCENMSNLQVQSSQIRVFKDKFINTIKQFMPQTFIDDLGGVERIKLTVNKLLEYLCYENGIISSFDSGLINYIADGTLSLLRSDQQQLEPFLNKLKSSTIPISNAEFYLVKVALSKVMTQMNFPDNQISQIVQRLNKQRGYFFSLMDYSKDQSFRNMFIQSISKNKKIVGYFLDPSQNTIHAFYEILFQTINGGSRYIDLIDFFEHKLKTTQTPLIMIEEIQKTIIEIFNSSQNEPNFLMQKDIQIKMDRVKQKAGLLSYCFLKIGMSVDTLVSQLIEWCEYALININLPHGVQEDSIIKPEFLREYLFLVLQEEEQLFSIFDLDYSINYHSINSFEYCFSLWLTGIHEILSKKQGYPKEYLKKLISYLRQNSILM